MCCVSLFCMGYTRPHTGQGKELSFGVWESIMRGQREREEDRAGSFHLLIHYPYQQTRALPRPRPHTHRIWPLLSGKGETKCHHSLPTAVQSQSRPPLLVPQALSSEPMESQRVSPGENAKAPQETRSVLVKQGHGLPPSTHRTHFCTTGSKKPHRKKALFRLQPGDQNPSRLHNPFSFKKPVSILENCRPPWFQYSMGLYPPSAHRSYAKEVSSLPEP